MEDHADLVEDQIKLVGVETAPMYGDHGVMCQHRMHPHGTTRAGMVVRLKYEIGGDSENPVYQRGFFCSLHANLIYRDVRDEALGFVLESVRT